MLEMYNFRNIVQAISFKHLFKKVDEPKKALLSFQTTRFKVSKVCYKNISDKSCDAKLAKGPVTFYRIIKLTGVVILFYLRRLKREKESEY